jgi:hypothetical protein
MAYKLSAQLSLRPPRNSEISSIKQMIQRGLGSFDVVINPRTNASLKQLHQTLNKSSFAASQFAASLNETGIRAAQASRHAQSMSQAMNGQIWGWRALAKSISENGNGLQNIDRKTRRLTTSINGAKKASSSLLQTWASVAGMSVVLFGSIRALTDQFSTLNELISDLSVNFAQVEGFRLSATSVRKFQNRLLTSGIGSGADIIKVGNAISDLAQAGIENSTSKEFIELISSLSLNKQVKDLTAASNAIILLRKSMGLSNEEIRRFLSQSLDIAKKTSVGFEHILAILSRVGSLSKSLGADLTYTTSLIATAVDKSQRPPAEMANALRSISVRLIDNIELARELNKYGTSLYDFDVNTGRNQFVGLEESLLRINDVLESLPEASKDYNSILTAAFGTRRFNQGIAIIKSAKEATDLQKKVQQNPNDIISKDAAIAAESLAVKIQKLKNETLSLFLELSRNSTIKTFASGIETVATAVVKLTKTFSDFLPLLGIFAAQKFGPQLLSKTNIIGKGPLPFSSIISSNGRKPVRAQTAVPAYSKLSQKFSDNLISYYKKQITTTNKNIDSIVAHTKAQNLARDAVRRNAKVWTRLDGSVTAVSKSLKQQAAVIGRLSLTPMALGAAGATLASLTNADERSPATEALIQSLFASSVGAMINPFVGAVSGVTVGLKSLSDSLYEQTQKIRDTKISTAFDQYNQLTGVDFSKYQQQLATNTIRQLTDGLQTTASNVNWFDGFKLYLQKQLTGDITGIEFFNEFSKGQLDNVREFVKDNQSILQKLTTDILTSGNVRSIEDFRNNNLGSQIYQLNTVMAKLSGTSGTYDEVLRKLIEDTKTQRKLGAPKKPFNSIIEERNILALNRSMSPSPIIRSTNGAPSVQAYDLSNRDTLQQTLSQLNLNQVGKRFLADLPTAKDLLADSLANINNLSPDTVKDALLKPLSKLAPKISSAVEDSLSDLSFEDLETSLREKGLAGTVDNLLSPLNNLTNQLQAYADKIQLIREQNLEQITDLNDQRKRSVDSRLALLDTFTTLQQTQKRFAKERQPTGIDNARARFEAFSLTGSSNVDVLGNRLQKLEQQYSESLDSRLIPEIQTTVDALKILGDAGKRTADHFTELQRVEAQDTNKRNVLEGFLTGNIRQKLEITREVVRGKQLAQLFAQGANFRQVNPQFLKEGIKGLNLLGDTELAGTGKTGKEIKEAILSGFLGLQQNPKREDIQQKILRIQQEAVEAQKNLVARQENIYQQHLLGLSQENKRFLDGLWNLYNRNNGNIHGGGGVPVPQQISINDGGFNQQLSNNMTVMNNNVNMFANAAANIPSTIDFRGNVNHTININGAQVLNNLTPAIETMVQKEIHKAINQAFKDKFPEMGPIDHIQYG